MAEYFDVDNYSKNLCISNTDSFRGNDRGKAYERKKAWDKDNYKTVPPLSFGERLDAILQEQSEADILHSCTLKRPDLTTRNKGNNRK